MSETPNPEGHPTCARCARVLSGEKPVRLPDARSYCAACCEGMATEAFELETGMPFVAWIERHPELVLEHQPLELTVRRAGFFLPLAGACLGLLIVAFGAWKMSGGGMTPPTDEQLMAARDPWDVVERNVMAHMRASLGFVAVGLGALMLFGWLAWRQGQAFLRARGFRLSLKDGVFRLAHGGHHETFGVNEVTRACVVRPGTVGATEGALGLADGRMLTLDTCLSDLHALGVVMDLRLSDEFPPSVEELARERRERLRKIRGLS